MRLNYTLIRGSTAHGGWAVCGVRRPTGYYNEEHELPGRCLIAHQEYNRPRRFRRGGTYFTYICISPPQIRPIAEGRGNAGRRLYLGKSPERARWGVKSLICSAAFSLNKTFLQISQQSSTQRFVLNLLLQRNIECAYVCKRATTVDRNRYSTFIYYL